MMENILKKLHCIQNELVAPKNQWNKFGGYNYRSCEDILEGLKKPLDKHGCSLVIRDDIVFIEGRHYLKATATLYDNETGEHISNHSLARESETKKGMDDAQITGATSSYARKYCLNGLFMIDDQKDADTPELKVESANKTKPTARETVTAVNDSLVKEKEDLQNLINENAKNKKMTKKESLAILKKNGIDSVAFISTKEQYNKILKEIKEITKE